MHIFKGFAKAYFCNVRQFFHPKTSPKPFQNEAWATKKSMSKNASLFDIDFFASWPRFWSLLGLQDGAKLAILASKNQGWCSFWAFLSQASFKNGVLEATGLEFGASGLDFGGVWARFWNFGMLQNRFWKALDLLWVCFLKDLWVPHLGSPVDNCGDAISAISFHSIPFCSIPLHCVPLHSIPFGSILVPFDRFRPRRDARSVNNTRGFRPQTRVGLTLTSGLVLLSLLEWVFVCYTGFKLLTE